MPTPHAHSTDINQDSTCLKGQAGLYCQDVPVIGLGVWSNKWHRTNLSSYFQTITES